MVGFSPEIYKQNKPENGNFNSEALSTLKKLEARTKHLAPLFETKEYSELDQLIEKYPNEYALHMNEKAFQELSPAEQKQIMEHYDTSHS